MPRWGIPDTLADVLAAAPALSKSELEDEDRG
jgi:hypothetical protein